MNSCSMTADSFVYPITGHFTSSAGRVYETRIDWDEEKNEPKPAIFVSYVGHYWRKTDDGYIKVNHPRILCGASQLTIWDVETNQWDHLIGFDKTLDVPFGSPYYGARCLSLPA